MIEIKLTQGQVTWVDDCDADLSELNWCAHYDETRGTYYAVRSTNPGTERLHRVILGRILGREPRREELTDHQNHNTLDNRRSNLRIAAYQSNGANRLPNRAGTSPYKGVSYVPSRDKWLAQIKINGKSKFLGRTDTPEEAARLYDDAARDAYGDFAYTNEEHNG